MNNQSFSRLFSDGSEHANQEKKELFFLVSDVKNLIEESIKKFCTSGGKNVGHLISMIEEEMTKATIYEAIEGKKDRD